MEELTTIQQLKLGDRILHFSTWLTTFKQGDPIVPLEATVIRIHYSDLGIHLLLTNGWLKPMQGNREITKVSSESRSRGTMPSREKPETFRGVSIE